ncbi:MAG: sulfatase-like hydrolase/transferase, partial [Kordiimonadaceae bacterium]|nr:sulfatase-like hydrolase/transferase [Kordiimonadaceae bacterium]
MKHLVNIIFAVIISSSVSIAAENKLPNIVLMMADDAGIETISSYGSDTYKTPNIDAIATDGMRFTHAYSQPLCTPSRVKLMTGKYNYRNYLHFTHLDPGETTFAHLLKDNGYKTMIAGKWQLFGDTVSPVAGSLPDQAGFDEHILWQIYRETRGNRYWHPTLTSNGEAITYEPTDFGPDIMNDYVLDFMERQSNNDQPFLVYYPLVLPHDPFVATPDFPDAKTDHEKFTAMVSHMDKMVGNVKNKINQLGIAEDTLFIFIS